MTSHGKSYGAVSVINAIPCGIGATMGISLETNVTYSEGGEGRDIEIVGAKNMSKAMARICVKKTLERIRADRSIPYSLTIDSQIPPSRGLKSSSSVCNAIISAVLQEHGAEMDTIEMIRLGVECAREAKVTVTGSFDDACGCHLGGLVFTDNRKDMLLSRTEVPSYDAVLMIPKETIEKKTISVAKYAAKRDEMQRIIETAKEDPLAALTANGRVVADVIGMDNSLAERALELGALAAGVTGTGPAVAVIAERGRGKSIARKLGGRYILSETRS